MLRKIKIAAGIFALFASMAMPAHAQTGRRLLLLSGGPPSWILPGAASDMYFAQGQYYGCSLATCLSITRASPETDLLPTSASGYAYNTYGNNVLAISPGVGLLIFESRTNFLLNSTAPVTQTTGSLANGAYTLWVNGAGSAQMSAGTATGCGTGTATNGSPVTFTLSGAAGTCTVTVTGALNAFQLEKGSFGTPFIVTAGATATRAQDVILATGALRTVLLGASGAVVAVTNLAGGNLVNNPRIVGRQGNVNTWTNFQSGNVVSYNGSVLISTAAVTASTLTKSGVSWGATPGRSIVANGGTVVKDANAMNNAGVPQIGNGFNSVQDLDGAVTRLTDWSIRPSDAAFKAATQ